MSVSTVTVCLTCLSTTRNVYPIEDGIFFASLTLLQLSDPSKCRLCWECYAAVRRAKFFREKALKAHSILTGQCVPENLPLSSLGCKELNDYIYVEYVPPDMSEFVENPVQYPRKEDVCKNQMNIQVEDVKTCPISVFDEESRTDQRTEQEMIHESGPQVILVKAAPPIKVAAPPIKNLHEELVLKQEVIESDPSEEAIVNDPFEMDQSIVQEPVEPVTLDIVKSENYSSDDDEPLEQVKKRENVGYISINHTTDTQTVQDASSSAPTASFHYAPIMSIPIQYEPLPNQDSDIETNTERYTFEPSLSNNIDSVGKCTIRTLSEAEMKEFRKVRLGVNRTLSRYYCDSCVRVFRAKSYYDAHMHRHNEVSGDFKCTVCEVRFEREESLTAHAAVQYRIITCNICGAEFTTYQGFSRHYEQHEGTEMTCSHCGETFPNKTVWRRHVQKHQPFVECTDCKKLIRKDLLSTHAKSHEPQPMLGCEECGKEFQGQYKLGVHMRVCHAQLGAGEAYCAKCDKQFKTRSQYQMHLRTSAKHVLVKRMQCHICPRKFTCLSYLNLHMARCHRNNDCKECSQRFATDYALRRHVRLVHQQRGIPKTKICDYCGRSFAALSTLRQHIYSHMNIRPYECTHCGKRFNYHSAMYTHIKMKHKKKK